MDDYAASGSRSELRFTGSRARRRSQRWRSRGDFQPSQHKAVTIGQTSWAATPGLRSLADHRLWMMSVPPRATRCSAMPLPPKSPRVRAEQHREGKHASRRVAGACAGGGASGWPVRLAWTAAQAPDRYRRRVEAWSI